uniref:Reverse transcriptase zinc-binding domain-containing protein n=1 Tax=Nicotiana tabacum TaxID=4097 RepID=A0A1S4B6P7_TOBAC|nr:PREDICTED: uncharacterized protein LOC107805145 [Nicotiana tabacum]
MEEAGYREDDVQQLNTFSIKTIYRKLTGDCQKVEWRRMICNNQASPRWIFVLYLTLHGKLLTRDRLTQWYCLDNVVCPLCGEASGSINHLFFACAFSSEVWKRLLEWQGIQRQAMGWQYEKE